MFHQKPVKPAPYIVMADYDSTESFRFQELLDHKKIPYVFSFASSSEMLFKMLDEYDAVPDIILLDLPLSDITANECMETLKRKPDLNRVPVIIYSRSADSRDVDYCYNTRASEYFATALEYFF